MTIDKDKFKIGLIGLGIVSIVAIGITQYFTQEKDYLTYEEYLELIVAYNLKIEEIKNDCDRDVRCVKNEEKPNVIFRNVKTKEDIIKQMNDWIKDDSEDPNTYKTK